MVSFDVPTFGNQSDSNSSNSGVIVGSISSISVGLTSVVLLWKYRGPLKRWFGKEKKNTNLSPDS